MTAPVLRKDATEGDLMFPPFAAIIGAATFAALRAAIVADIDEMLAFLTDINDGNLSVAQQQLGVQNKLGDFGQHMDPIIMSTLQNSLRQWRAVVAAAT